VSASAQRAEVPGHFTLVGRTVLVVEDHPDSRQLLVELLRSLRAHVYTAQNLDEAERLLSVYKFHLVVSDMKLPDGTGLDLIHWIRRQHKGIKSVPCIAVTGYEQQFPADVAKGFNAYMRKPINIDRFCDVAVALASG
jgi:two-component system, NtrC family, response regulator PilR